MVTWLFVLSLLELEALAEKQAAAQYAECRKILHEVSNFVVEQSERTKQHSVGSALSRPEWMMFPSLALQMKSAGAGLRRKHIWWDHIISSDAEVLVSDLKDSFL